MRQRDAAMRAKRSGGRQLSEAVRHVYREIRDSVLLKIITGTDDVFRTKMRPVPADKPVERRTRVTKSRKFELIFVTTIKTDVRHFVT